jgi:DNA-binding NtrC family response regulator
MAAVRTVLLVSPTSRLRHGVARVLRRDGHRTVVARTFEAAKAQLAEAPDLLITELKLGEYNGLQLALRVRSAGVPAIVVADESFARDVEETGATWVTPEGAVEGELQSLVSRMVPESAADRDGIEWRPESPENIASFLLPPQPTAHGLH